MVNPAVALLNFPAIFLPVPFAGQRLLGPELFTRLQIERVSFDLFDNVLLLDLTFEAAKSIFKSFTLLKLYFSQMKYTSPLDRDFHAGRISGETATPGGFGANPKNFLPSAQKVLIS